MSINTHEYATSSGNLFHYFSIIGLKFEGGLCPSPVLSQSFHDLEEYEPVAPLVRSYKSYILGTYPEKVPSFPFDEDAVQMFCLPKGLQLRTQKDSLEPHFHPFVITREDASQYYGFCFTFYEEVTSSQICTSLYSLQSAYLAEMSCTQGKVSSDSAVSHATHSLPRQIRLCSSEGSDSRKFYDITKDKLFVTKCICLVGPHPVLMAAILFLSDLYKVFVDCDTDVISLDVYVYNLLHEVPAPPIGKCLSFLCIKKEHICVRASSNEIPLLEYSLQEFFSILGVETVIQLLCCVLLENQIIIISSDYYKLMLVAECICALIFPFNWQNVYVPILPSTLNHFLDAPVPFIMGIQTDLENDVLEIPNEANLCLLDVDRGNIEVPEDFPQLPNKSKLSADLLRYFQSTDAQFEQRLTMTPKSKREPAHISNSSLYESTKHTNLQSRWCSLPKTKNSQGNLEDLQNNPVAKPSRGPEYKYLRNLPQKDDEEWVQKVLVFNSGVREIFFNWIVQMFYSYENFISVTNVLEDVDEWLSAKEKLHTFDKATFLVDQPDSSLPFLSRFMESQLFTSFIDQKILSAEKSDAVRIFDRRIQLFRSKFEESDVLPTVASLDFSWTVDETRGVLLKRMASVDFQAPRPMPHRPEAESYTHFNPGHFPLLDKTILNKIPVKRKDNAKVWQRRERQAKHMEQAAFSVSQREKVLQEARLLAHTHPKLSNICPAHVAHTNWMFVEQLLKECKTRSKKMLLLKMGSEAVELGHGQSSLIGVEENTLIASLCDMLERIWGHGLQKKHGKSALWTYLVSYQEGLDDVQSPNKSSNSSFQLPALAWEALRKRIDNLSSQTMELEDKPTDILSRDRSSRSRSVDGTFDKQSTLPPGHQSREDSRRHYNSPRLPPVPITVTFDMRNVLAMREIKSEIGFARAWVRLSLEKKLLSKHLNEVLGKNELLRTLYKRYAFLRCEDEKEQFLSYLLSLNAVDYFCFTNKYLSAIFPYRVVIFSSRKMVGATTSANVWVSVGGTLGSTSQIKVPKNCHELTFQHQNLGLLTTLRIGHDNSGISPKWMVEHVLVRNDVTGHTWKFPCGRWLGKGIEDGSLERILVGGIVPDGCADLSEVSYSPTHNRSRSPGPVGSYRTLVKSTPSQIQQHLGNSVNSIVKFFYKPERERGSLTLLLCGDSGLVHSLDLVFSYGFKSSRFFGRNFYIWDYFERVQYQFHLILKDEIEHQNLSGLVRDDRTHGYSTMASFTRLVSKVNSSSLNLGKDDKFQLFVCVAARSHLLHQLVLPLQRCIVTSQMYEKSSFLREPSLVKDLINVLSALSEFDFVLENTLTRGIEF